MLQARATAGIRWERLRSSRSGSSAAPPRDTGTGTFNTGTFTDTVLSLTTGSAGATVGISINGSTAGNLTLGNLTLGAGNYPVVYGGATNSTIDLQHKATIGSIGGLSFTSNTVGLRPERLVHAHRRRHASVRTPPKSPSR